MNDETLIPVVATKPAKPHRKAVRVYFHDYNKARREAARNGNDPLLRYHNGADTILLPTGQQVRKDPKPRNVSGKALRRERIRLARIARGDA